jgi:hypothetical protein
VVAHATDVLEAGFSPRGFNIRDPQTLILLAVVLVVDTAFLVIIWVAHFSKKEDTLSLMRNICAMSWFRQLEEALFADPVS